MTDLVVERMEIGRDLDAILAIDAVSFTSPWTRDMFEWEAAHSDVARVFVARLPGKGIVAYCACWLVFDELHINNVAVAPEWRRKGVARALLSRVLEMAAAEGAERATLEVRRSNSAAVQLYESLGFRLEGVRTGYYREPPDDALVMWRDGLRGGVQRS